MRKIRMGMVGGGPGSFIGAAHRRAADLDAFVYIMHEERLIGIPTLWYLRTCALGYDRFGFDRAVLGVAYQKSQEFCGLRRCG